MLYIKMLIRSLFICSLGFSSQILGLTVGSDTAVNAEVYVQFPASESNTNEVLGFSAFVNGFGLESDQTTCTFNNFFPVYLNAAINGGTINLEEDLTFAAGFQIMIGGKIDAHGHAIIFQTTTNNIQLKTSKYDLPLCYGDVWWAPEFKHPYGDIPWAAIDWTYDDKYTLFASNGSSIIVYCCTGREWVQQKAYGLSSTPTITDAEWHAGDYYFAVGTQKAVAINELQIGLYNAVAKTFSFPQTIDEATTIHGLDWSSSGSYLLVCRQDEPYLKVFSFNTGTYLTLVDSTTGYPVALGDDSVYHTVSWNADNSYFVAGSVTGTNHAELTIYSFDGSTISEVTSFTTGASVSCVDWSWTHSYIAVGLESTSTWLRIYQFTPPATLTEAITYTGSVGTVNAVNWNSDGTKLAVGVDVDSGFSVFLFDSSLVILTLLRSDVSNGNVLTARWSHGIIPYTDCLVPTGNMTGYVITYYSCPLYAVGFKDAAIQFSGIIFVNSPLYFEGVNVLDGRGASFYLGSAGSIIVESGASLLLKDLTLYNVKGSNICCVDNQSTISFSNVTLMQDNDVTFTQGQLAIVGDLMMTGSSSFNYYSEQVSRIYDGGTWKFDAGMTFNYQPTNSANNLIAFENERSKLHLYETNLAVPSTGLRLTKGWLMIEGPCRFISQSTTETGGVWLGNGSSGDDLKIKVLPESGIIAEQGYVLYKNIN